MVKYTIEKATKTDLDYVWNNIRKIDLEEITIQGMDNTNYDTLLGMTGCYVGSADNVPVIIFGYGEWAQTIWLFFIGTTEINRHMQTFHKGTQVFLEWLEDKYLGKRILVRVWNQHRISVRWLKKLGFKYTNTSHGTENERFDVYEK